MGQSRVEDILEATIDAEPYTGEPQSRVEELLIELKETIEENPGGASDLVDLDDVNISQVNDGQVLKYNSQTSKWENQSDEGGTVVEANPQGEATTDLTKLKVANTTYGIPQGTPVEANPSGEGTADLTKLKVGNNIYDIPTGGTSVVANPSGEATDELEKVQIGNTIYDIPSGGGSVPNINIYDNGTEGVTLDTGGRTVTKETDYISFSTGGGTFDSYVITDTAIDLTSYDILDVSCVYNTSELSNLISLSNYSGLYYIGFGYITDSTHNECAVSISSTKEFTNLITVGSTTSPTNVLKLYELTLVGKSGGTTVVANPEGDPTDILKTIEIDGTVYDVPGGDKWYVQKHLAYTVEQGGRWESFTNPDPDSDMIVEVTGRGTFKEYYIIPKELPDRSGGDYYVTIGQTITGININVGQTNDAETVWISLQNSFDPAIEVTKVYNIIGYNNIDGAEELYSASQRESTITLDKSFRDYEYINILGVHNANNRVYRNSIIYKTSELENGNLIGISDDMSYVWYMITNDTSWAFESSNSGYYFTKIYGFNINSGASDPSVSFLYWANWYDSTITLEEDIRNFDRIMIFTNGGKPFTCDPADYFNGVQEYFGVGMASNKYVWYSVGSDGKTLTSAYHDGLEITLIIGVTGMDTDCPWGASHDH